MMMPLTRVLRVAVLSCLAHFSLVAGPRNVELKWSGLSPLVTHQKVALVLPAGTRIEGKVLAVEPDGLRLRVTKTSDRKLLAKGERLIPRESISTLRLTKYRKTGRLLCTLGALAVAGGIIASQDIDVYEGPLVAIVPAVEVLGTAGTGVAGYFIGKRLDRSETYIRILPGD